MWFNPKLGMQGNIEKLFVDNQFRSIEAYSEKTQRKQADDVNREAVEQSLTDLYLDGIQAQQDITDIQLQLLGG